MTSRHRGGNPYGYPPAADMGGMYNNANDNYDPHKKERMERMMETDNDSLVLDLSNKISALKGLTIGIGDEVRSQNAFLDDMHDDFGRSSGLLSGAMKRLKAISAKGGGQMCYLMMFACFVMLVLWWLIR